MDKFWLIMGTILRAVLGMNTQDSYEGKANAPRPMILSRRGINGSLTIICALLGTFMGIDIPEDAIAQLMDTGTQLYETAMINKPIALAFVTSVTTFIGHIKRKK